MIPMHIRELVTVKAGRVACYWAAPRRLGFARIDAGEGGQIAFSNVANLAGSGELDCAQRTWQRQLCCLNIDG